MKKIIIICLSVILCLLVGGSILAKDSKKNKIRHNNPIIEALWCRQSPMAFTAADEFKDEDPDLSRFLCWAAVGVNGIKLKADGTPSDKTKLTIPTAMNKQHIIVYAVNKDGVYQYDPDNDELVPVPGMDDDFRKDAAMQPPYQTNPLILIFVADLSKFSGDKPGGFYPNRDELVYAAAISVGCAAENVYLYMASTKGRLGAHYYTAMKKQLWHEYLGLPDLCEDDDVDGNCEYDLTDPENPYIEAYLAPDKLVMGAMTIGYPGYPITCPCPSE